MPSRSNCRCMSHGAVVLQIQQGTWFDDPKRPYKRAHKTQIQELLGYFLGKWGARAIYVMMFTMVGDPGCLICHGQCQWPPPEVVRQLESTAAA